jgi:ABC-type branched-subunit amino acid transport system permease subunit
MIMIATLATVLDLMLSIVSLAVSAVLGYPLVFSVGQILFSLVSDYVLALLLDGFSSYKLIRVEPTAALRK